MIFIGGVAVAFFTLLMKEELDHRILDGLRLGVWEYFLIILDGVINVILCVIIYTFAVKNSSGLRNSYGIAICPRCGEWNEYEEISLDRYHYDEYGNKIGHDNTLRCTKCGEEFENSVYYNDDD